MSLEQFFGQGGYDTSTAPPADDFDVLPTDKYPVVIDAAEVKQNSKRTGHLLVLKLTVLAGPFKGRVIFDNLNIDNPSEVTVKIAMQSLSALGVALGMQKIPDESLLVRRVCLAHVKNKGGENSVRTYSAYTDAASVQQPQMPHVPQPTPPGGLPAPVIQQPQAPPVQYQPQPQQAPPVQYQQLPAMQPQAPPTIQSEAQSQTLPPGGPGQPAVPWAQPPQ